MFKSTLSTLAAVALLAFAGSAMAGDVPDAAKTCFDCHGESGVSKHEHIPTIAGMSSWYLEGQMQAYQKGDRPCEKIKNPTDASKGEEDMCDIAKKLSGDEITKVAEYFAGETFVPAKQTFDADKAALGKKVHELECEKCHSEGGSYADDDAGILAGQWIPYLRLTFKEYESGKRVMPEKMKPKMDQLTPEQTEALIQYYASEGAK
ncbi:MAG: c-type cytochrome [Gammaproteobacteria bacterium]|jgi:sulfide dehydrogenase cytochrome subunit